MADEKFVSNILQFRGGRLAFPKINKAEARKGKNGAAPKPDAKKYFSYEVLLDPSNVDHAKTIAEIKAEAKRALDFKLGAGNWAPGAPNFHLCFGLGNDLPKQGRKISDGYKDMFWIRLKRNEEDGPPLTANRRGALVKIGEPQYPYGGCTVNGKFTMWAYDNESRGCNATGRSLQFVADGKAFGAGGTLDAEEEFEALGDPVSGDTGGGKDPFDLG